MLKYAWLEIVRRKGRTTAAILSYALATMIFVLLVSLLQYLNHCTERTLRNTGTHFIAFKPVCCNLPLLKDESNEGFWANGARSAIMPISLIDDIKRLPTVADASPLLMFRFKDSTNSNGLLVGGLDPENDISVANTACSAADIVEGRFITSYDTNAVMVEQSFALIKKINIGKFITISDVPFQIIGVVNAGIRPVKADIYMPIKQAEQIISRRTWNPIQASMNIILVESANAQLHKQAVADVMDILGKDNIVSSYACHKPAASVMNFNRQILILGIILITVFVIFHVLKTNYASMIERRREIGILQSMGWPDKKIACTIAYEFIFQAFLGGVLGSYSALLLQLIIPAAKSTRHVLCAIDTFGNALIGLSITVMIATISAFAVAIYALRFHPMKNLRMP